MYLINIITTHWDGAGVQSVFVTKDKSKAEKWVDRFNKIINSRKEWIHKFNETEVASKSMHEPFWYHYALYEDPVAEFKEISAR